LRLYVSCRQKGSNLVEQVRASGASPWVERAGMACHGARDLADNGRPAILK